MTAPDRSWMVAVVVRCVSMALLLGVVAVTVGGVEGSGRMVSGELSAYEWWVRAAEQAIGVVVDVLPVIIAIGAASVAGSWFDSGKSVALEASGWSASRWAVLAGCAGAVVAMAALAVMEFTAPLGVVRAAEQDWVMVDSPDPDGAGADEVAITASAVLGGVVMDVRAAWFREGELVAVGQVDQAVWTGQRWSMRGRRVHLVPSMSEARTVLPHPDNWANGRVPLSDRSSLRRLWLGKSAHAPKVWATKRLLLPLFGFGLAACAVLLGPAGRARGVLAAVMGFTTGVAWNAVWASAARGGLPLSVVAVVTVVGCVLATIAATHHLTRFGLARQPWPALPLMG